MTEQITTPEAPKSLLVLIRQHLTLPGENMSDIKKHWAGPPPGEGSSQVNQVTMLSPALREGRIEAMRDMSTIGLLAAIRIGRMMYSNGRFNLFAASYVDTLLEVVK